jgi:hypothetical protein
MNQIYVASFSNHIIYITIAGISQTAGEWENTLTYVIKSLNHKEYLQK